jgi:hypothetical protein
VKEEILALRQKLGKLIVVVKVSFLFIINLNEMHLMTCLYSFSFINIGG